MRHARIAWLPVAVLLSAAPSTHAICNGGTPDGTRQAGEACDDGNLVDADCCANDCSDPCDDHKTCTSDTCTVENGLAACRHQKRPAGTACDDDVNPCTHDACNSQGKCVHTALSSPEGSCDQSLCTHDTCVDGACRTPPVRCDDGDPCTVDTCDAATGQCRATPSADGAPCRTDACHASGTCQAGTCSPGAAVVCLADGDPCTTTFCDPAIGCRVRAKADNTPCEATEGGDDGKECTADVCRRGRCEHDDRTGAQCSLGPCQPRGTCAGDACSADGITTCRPPGPCETDGQACEDGDPCSTASACHSGVCTGTCTDPCPTDGLACDDRNLCTSGSACAAGACAGIGCNVGTICVEPCGLSCQILDGQCRCAP